MVVPVSIPIVPLNKAGLPVLMSVMNNFFFNRRRKGVGKERKGRNKEGKERARKEGRRESGKEEEKRGRV